ncbi:MAG TPA: ribonuclease J [Polyangiaceae bacterium]|nr:ribonuclease J [Polyangiaceae bacterium]
MSPESIVRLIPLGGLGEIGMNCLVIEDQGSSVIVDCGAAFPEDDLGVDVIHPDFDYVLQHHDRLRGVFLTHGHEDHIGALPYLLSELEVPVWGPPHALGMARKRLLEHGFGPNELDFRVATPGQSYEVGPFQIEPVRVAHSIVEASALAIRTSQGIIFHSGDFNFDPDPPDGEPTDEARIRELGDEGIGLLLSDSTNIDVPERAGSERSVGAVLERLIEAAPARVVVALFASNIQRLILLGEIARRTGRKLCLLGRSLDAQVTVAKEIKRLGWLSDLLVSADEVREMKRERVLILAGGTQAERLSAMRRLADGVHPLLSLQEGDTVILSSRVIPGNDRPVIAMVNAMHRRGLTVHTRITEPGVHTSGHAGRSEQRRMLELTRPRCFMPVHGTLHHLLRHAELGRSLGVSQTVVVENGAVVGFDGQSANKIDAVRSGRIPIAIGGEVLSGENLQRRQELGRLGIATVALALDGRKLFGPPVVATRGVPNVDGDAAALRSLALEAARAVEQFREGRGLELSEHVRRSVRRKIEDLSGTRPVVEVSVVQAD